MRIPRFYDVRITYPELPNGDGLIRYRRLHARGPRDAANLALLRAREERCTRGQHITHTRLDIILLPCADC